MVTDAELAVALERSLAPPVHIRDRQPWPYASSFPLEGLEVETGDGARLGLVWKDLSPGALLPAARLARTAAADPTRELRAYDLLEVAQLGAPRRYAAVHDPSRAWLFLEAVHGRRLDEVGERDIWRAVARWLAHAHGSLTPWARGLEFPPRWRRPDFEALAARADESRGKRIAALASPLAVAWAMAAARPPAVIHGALYPANVLIAAGRVCVLDWKTIARGPALLDLAALTAGRWDEPGEPLAEAYRTALPDPPSRADLLTELDACRLLVAAGWLAAPPQAKAPLEQAPDWLADAESVAARLRV